MKLYHGTSSNHLNDITKNGILPRGDRPSVWQAHPSLNKHVYLTDAYPIYFAMNAVEGDEDLLVVEVDVDHLLEANFYPDEDFIAQAMMQQAKGKSNLTELTADARKHIEDYQHLWEFSLANLGNCSYRGAISPEAITRLATISQDRIDILQPAMDPTISLMNYKICGEKYHSMVRWLFEDMDEWIDDFYRFKNIMPAADYEKSAKYHQNRCQNREGIKVISFRE